jgi:hypothetical protein
MKKDSFLYWLFEKRDVDGLIIAILVSNAIAMFTKDLSTAIIEPVIAGFLPTNEDDEQVLNIYNKIIIKFKLQFIISGLTKVAVNLYFAYLIVSYVYKRILNI